MKPEDIQELVKRLVERELEGIIPSSRPIPIGVSARHVHLSGEHLEILFGKGYELRKLRDLSQPGQFAAEETVTLVGPKGVIEKVRILGPLRKRTQVELAKTDAIKLGVDPPVRDSGDLDGTPGITIVGPKGAVTLEEGVIIAKRHIHMTPQDAREFQVQDRDIVRVICGNERKVIFDEVLIRVSENYALDFHLDTDEANAAGVKTGDTGILLKYRGEVKVPEKRYIQKRLITEKDVREAEKKGYTIILTKGTIITPLARELASRLGILEVR
ncbi:propanediol utilization protein [bacterium]|nr:MAG: propanediol utilization protein [bacterium]